MNFKRDKAKEKKLIEYGTPKYIQSVVKRSLHSIPGERKYKCKKQKGDHTFTLIETSEFLLWRWEYYRCMVCGKKKFVNV